jgi:hypothetical protein
MNIRLACVHTRRSDTFPIYLIIRKEIYKMKRLSTSVDRRGELSVSIDGERLEPMEDNHFIVTRGHMAGIPLHDAHPKVHFFVVESIEMEKLCNGVTAYCMVRLSDAQAEVAFNFQANPITWRGSMHLAKYIDAAKGLVKKLSSAYGLSEVEQSDDPESGVAFLFRSHFDGTTFDAIIRQADALDELITVKLGSIELAVENIIQQELAKPL